MTDRVRPDRFDLEAQLADLAGALAFPPTPDLATAIGARLRAPGSGPTPAPAPAPAPRVTPFRRSVRRSLLLAAVLALAVVGGALAVRYGLELLQIRFGPVPTIGPSASPSAATPPTGTPAPLGTSLGLGEPMRLDDVLAISSFRVLVPAVLGPPDAVFVGGERLRGQVAFVYAARGDLPRSRLLGGAGLLITQARGEPDAGLASKLLDAGLATVQNVVVDGAPGVWISGKPHIFWYLAPDGTFIQDSRREVGDTLAWERDGALYRIEGAITLEQALAIARSMR